MMQLFAIQGVIDVVTGKSEKQLRDIDKQAREVGQGMGGAAEKVALLSNSLLSLAKIGAVMAPFAIAGKLAMEFERQIRNVNSILKLSEPALVTFSERMRTLGVELGVASGPAETAAAAYDVASSGFTKAADATKVLSAALIAASAGLTDAKTAATGIVAALNAYSLGADQAARISDVMFKTVDAGVTTFPELANSMGQTLAIAAAAGVSFEELMGTVAVLTQRGFKTDMAFTAMRSAISKLIAPTEEQQKVMQQYGITIDENTIKQKGIVRVLRDMTVATGGSKEAMSKLIGDLQGVAGAMSLMSDKGDAAKRSVDGMAMAGGSSMRTHLEMAKAVENQWEIFKTKILAAATAFGQTFLPAANSVLDIVSKIADAANAIPKPMMDTVATLLAVGAGVFAMKKGIGIAVTMIETLAPAMAGIASAPIGVAIGMLGTKFVGLATSVGGATGITAKFGTVLRGLGLNPVTIAVLALGAAFKFYIDKMDEANTKADETLQVQGKMASWLTQNRKLWGANAEEVMKYGGAVAEIQFIAGLVHARQEAEAEVELTKEKIANQELYKDGIRKTNVEMAAEKVALQQHLAFQERIVQKNAEQIAMHRKQLPEVQKLEAAQTKAADAKAKSDADAAKIATKAWATFKADREAGIFATKDAELRALDETKKHMKTGTNDWWEMARARVQLQRQARDESLKTQEAVAEGEAELARAGVTSAERVLKARLAAGHATIADEQRVRDAAIAAADAELASKTKKIDDEVLRHGGAAKLTADQEKLFAGQRTAVYMAHVEQVAAADARLAESRRAQKVQRMQDLQDLWAMEKSALDREIAFLELRKNAPDLADDKGGRARVDAELASARQARVDADLAAQRIATAKELENASLTAEQRTSIIRNGAAREKQIRDVAAMEDITREEQKRQARVTIERQMESDILTIMQGETATRKVEMERQVAAYRAAGVKEVKIAEWVAAQKISEERRVANERATLIEEILTLQGKEMDAEKMRIERRAQEMKDAAKGASDQAEREVLIEIWKTEKLKALYKQQADAKASAQQAAASAAGTSGSGSGAGASAGTSTAGGGTSIGSGSPTGASGGGATTSGGAGGTQTSFGSFDLTGGHRMGGSAAPSSLTYGQGGGYGYGDGKPVDTSQWQQAPMTPGDQARANWQDLQRQRTGAATQGGIDQGGWNANRMAANLAGRGVESVVGLGPQANSIPTAQNAALAGAKPVGGAGGSTTVTHDVKINIGLDGKVNVESGPLSQSTINGITNDIGLQSHIMGDRPQGLGRTR